MQESFEEAVDYCKFFLKNQSQHHKLTMASRTARLVKTLETQLKENDFDDIDTIYIVESLRKVRNACDNIGILKEEATRLMF